MAFIRFLFLLALFVLIAARVALADADGIYIARNPSTVAVFNLTDQDGQISGYYESLIIDPRSQGGLSRSHFSVYGSRSGSRVRLNLNPDNAFQLGYSWHGTLGWGSLTVQIPLTSGQISEQTFTRSSVSGLNSAVAAISAKAAHLHDGYAVYQSYNDASSELSAINNQLPQTEAKLKAAQTTLTQAQAKLRVAQADQARRKKIYDDANQVAQQALHDAHTQDESEEAVRLSSEAVSRNSEYITAGGDVISAQGSVQSAQWDVDRLSKDVVQMRARRDQLQQIVMNDRAYLRTYKP